MRKPREELENSKSLKQMRRNDNGRICMTSIIDEKGKILTDTTQILDRSSDRYMRFNETKELFSKSILHCTVSKAV